jgi:magnesium chelatase accessory protein
MNPHPIAKPLSLVCPSRMNGSQCILLAHGERDATIPASVSNKVATRLPAGEALILPGLGHLAHEEAPAQHADLIIDFARRVGVLGSSG